MNVLSSSYKEISLFFSQNFLSSTPISKKIIAVALLALTGLAALYYLYHLKKLELKLKDSNIQDKKVTKEIEAKLEALLPLLLECQKYDPNFKLSCDYDKDFDPSLIHSPSYCEEYMNAYIANVKMEMFSMLLEKCKTLNPNFELSSSFMHFDDKQVGSISYCIDAMKNYLCNMYDMAWIPHVTQIAEFKKLLEAK